jgi:Ca-activated chloride channel homolog
VRRCSGAAALLVALATAATAQQPLTFEVQVDVVRLDVVVTQRGGPVEGLTADDFEVWDSGVRQRVQLVSADATEAATNAVLVLDTSGSTAGEKLAKLRAASQAFLEGLGPRDSASLILFAERLRLLSEHEVGRQALFQALDAAAPGGATALQDAMYVALSLGDPHLGRPIVLVFTDGVDNVSWLDPEQVRATARQSEAAVYVVLETPWILQRAVRGEDMLDRNSRSLLDIAEETGGRVWYAKSLDDLQEGFLGVLAEVRNRYLLHYEPQGVTREGWHEVKVRLKRGKGNVRTRRGYQRSPRS